MARIKGFGLYVPGAAIDNDELMHLTGIELDKRRLEAKLGIKARHIARLRKIDETSADFAEKAARAAIADAGIDATDPGLFIVGSDTPEYLSPSTAVLFQGRLQGGHRSAASFDLNTSCAGFVTALDVAARMLDGDRSIEYALVVGVYNMPAYVRDDDAFGWSIFADGAGAVVLEHSDAATGYHSGLFQSDGTQWDFVGVYAGGTRRPVTRKLLDEGRYGLELLQRLPGDRNVTLWPPLVQALLDKAGSALREVDHFIFTQINRSVIEQVMALLGRDMADTTTVMDRYGYTGSACVPMALYHAVKDGPVKPGHKVVLVASGAGLTVGANLLTI